MYFGEQCSKLKVLDKQSVESPVIVTEISTVKGVLTFHPGTIAEEP